jgi:hypothetical protein
MNCIWAGVRWVAGGKLLSPWAPAGNGGGGGKAVGVAGCINGGDGVSSSMKDSIARIRSSPAGPGRFIAAAIEEQQSTWIFFFEDFSFVFGGNKRIL